MSHCPSNPSMMDHGPHPPNVKTCPHGRVFDVRLLSNMKRLTTWESCLVQKLSSAIPPSEHEKTRQYRRIFCAWLLFPPLRRAETRRTHPHRCFFVFGGSSFPPLMLSTKTHPLCVCVHVQYPPHLLKHEKRTRFSFFGSSSSPPRVLFTLMLP